MRENVWQCLCGQIIEGQVESCPMCKRRKEDVFQIRAKKIEKGKKRFLRGARLILSLFALETSEKSDLVKRVQKNWGYSEEEIQEEVKRLAKEGYLHQVADICRLSEAGEELQLWLIPAKDKIL